MNCLGNLTRRNSVQTVVYVHTESALIMYGDVYNYTQRLYSLLLWEGIASTRPLYVRFQGSGVLIEQKR
jgi:hypothetical protein